MEYLSSESSQEVECSEELSDSAPLGSYMCGVCMDVSIPNDLSDDSAPHWISQRQTYCSSYYSLALAVPLNPSEADIL